MKPHFAAVLSLSILATSSPVSAGKSTYLCKIQQAIELSDNGSLVEHSGIYKQLIGESFTINRTTGEMIGLPFSTEAWLGGVQVLNPGGNGNGYKAIVLSGKPNVSAKYIYVAEQVDHPQKPFWGNGDNNVIFSGVCE